MTRSADPTVRRARPDEAGMLAELMARTFRDAFGHLNDPANLAAHLAQSYGPDIQAAQLADPAIITLLAEVDGVPAGYAMVRRNPDPPHCVTGPDPIELWRFYLTREWIGRGVAQPLMQSAMAAARTLGSRTLWLGVWEKNPRAIAFYGKSGFTDCGSQTFTVGNDAQQDRVMLRALEAS
jgi:GNAT superfamily N-acetyltransferase